MSENEGQTTDDPTAAAVDNAAQFASADLGSDGGSDAPSSEASGSDGPSGSSEGASHSRESSGPSSGGASSSSSKADTVGADATNSALMNTAQSLHGKKMGGQTIAQKSATLKSTSGLAGLMGSVPKLTAVLGALTIIGALGEAAARKGQIKTTGNIQTAKSWARSTGKPKAGSKILEGGRVPGAKIIASKARSGPSAGAAVGMTAGRKAGAGGPSAPKPGASLLSASQKSSSTQNEAQRNTMARLRHQQDVGYKGHQKGKEDRSNTAKSQVGGPKVQTWKMRNPHNPWNLNSAPGLG